MTRHQKMRTSSVSYTHRGYASTNTRRSKPLHESGWWKISVSPITLMYCTVSRMLYTPNSGGRIVLRSLQGVSSCDLLMSVSKTARRILGLVAIHPPTIPMHIACMYHLSNLHSKLFILAHEMVDKEPENAVSWYAVGVWYLTAKKWQDARTYFRYFRAHGEETVTDHL